jgi:hypothetical protein
MPVDTEVFRGIRVSVIHACWKECGWNSYRLGKWSILASSVPGFKLPKFLYNLCKQPPHFFAWRVLRHNSCTLKTEAARNARVFLQSYMGMSEVTLEVQLTETSLTLFITFWILVQISWKISIDFRVFIVSFYHSSFGSNRRCSF